MLKGSLNNQGYIFAETMLAVVLIAVMTMSLFPAYSHVQAERLHISEQREAIHLLYTYSQTNPATEGELQTFKGEFNDYLITAFGDDICIKWEGVNEREAKHCFPQD